MTTTRPDVGTRLRVKAIQHGTGEGVQVLEGEVTSHSPTFPDSFWLQVEKADGEPTSPHYGKPVIRAVNDILEVLP